MALIWLPALFAFCLQFYPLTSHRLITNPYPQQEWDSVIVSSDPIIIREKTRNVTTSLKRSDILRPQKRSYEECPDNDFACLYGNDANSGKDSNQVVDKFLEQYSHDGSPPEEKDSDDPRKPYWTLVDSQKHNHPSHDKKGWVTLDPIPWSTSKISKWHPNKKGSQENKPWDYKTISQRPAQQFWVSGSSYRPQMPTSQWGIGTNDIIIDNKPSNFPTGNYQGYGSTGQGSNYHQSYGYPGNYNQNQNYELKGSYPPSYSQNTHPPNYPTNGDGEWILLSTTKGYTHSQRRRWGDQKNLKNVDVGRTKPTEISKYHEENLNETYLLVGENPTKNRKSDGNGVGSSTGNESKKMPLQILYTGAPKDGEPVMTLKRKVRLQVLPSFESSSTSYGGLLEVDNYSQTVDEAQQEDEKMKNLKAIANVKRNKIRGYKLVPTSKIKGEGANHKNIMTMAAVGAGMIPATMALLVPMALSRRKRSLYYRHPALARLTQTNSIVYH